MFVLAVTGGIGAGKSEAARWFAEQGAVVLDLDRIARAITLHDPHVRERLIEAFGERVLRSSGPVCTAAVAEVAFASDEATRKLNAIVHPAVLRELAQGLQDLQLMEHPPRVVVIDVPLLAEAPAVGELADAVLAISAPEETRVARCVERGMAEDECRRRLARQAGDEERAALAGTVIDNTGSLEEFREELARFWDREISPHAA